MSSVDFLLDESQEEKDEKVFAFLINLRDSGVTNMWGASPYIEEHFGVGHGEASEYLIRWIKSFDG